MLNNVRNALCEMLCHARVVCIPVMPPKVHEPTREERMVERYLDMERRVDRLYWKPRDTFRL